MTPAATTRQKIPIKNGLHLPISKMNLNKVHFMSSLRHSISELFFLCNELRSVLNKITSETEYVKEIAMNASVVAGQAGKHSRVCTEIAGQISGTGKRMGKMLDSARNRVNSIANLALTAVVVELRLRQMLLAEMNLKPGSSQMLISSVIIGHFDKIYELVSGISKQVYEAQTILSSLNVLQMRLFGITKALRIESADLDGQKLMVMTGLSVDLNEASDGGLNHLVSLKRILKEVKRSSQDVKNLSQVRRNDIAKTNNF